MVSGPRFVFREDEPMTTRPEGPTPEDAAAHAAEEAADRPVEQITLRNGIVLRLKQVAPYLVRRAAEHLTRPEVPMAMVEAKGVEEPNPADPEYQRSLIRYYEEQETASLTTALVLGSEIVSVPPEMHGVDDDAWITEIDEAMALIGGRVNLHREGKARYVDWLNYYALSDEIDRFRLARLTTSGYALTEREVQAATDAFRRRIGGDADLVSAATAAAVVGDND